MTERIYETDGMIFDFTAVVTDCVQNGGGFAVTLDRSAFFPGGGGQDCDTGAIGEARVISVGESDGEMYHITDNAFQVGESVNCSIDGETRFRRMQNHSGEHVVSGLIHSIFGYENVGFHMGKGGVTLDLNGKLTAEDIHLIEREANAAIVKNIPIRVEFPTKDELAKMEYRSKIELEGRVRIVRIDSVDVCACCAPHMDMTGRIGCISIISDMVNRGGTRLTLLAGLDAADDYIIRKRALAESAALLSSKQPELPQAVSRLLEENANLRHERVALGRMLADIRLETLDETEGNICVFERLTDAEPARRLAEGAAEKCGGIAAVFYPSADGGYNYVMAARTVDLKRAAKELNAAIEGRGGGSRAMIQGKCNGARGVIERYFEELIINN